jgi:hypothetical protein
MGIGLNETPSGASVPEELFTGLVASTSGVTDAVLAAKTTPHLLALPSCWIRATKEFRLLFGWRRFNFSHDRRKRWPF